MLNRKGLLFLTCTIVWISGLSAAAAETIHLDLKEALARAPDANFQILLARESVISQSEVTRSTRSALLPQVQLDATQGRRMSPTNTDPFSDIIDQEGFPERFFIDRFDAVLRARLSILDTRSLDDWRLSKLSLQATERQLDKIVQDILEEIAVAYFTHWRNQRRMDVIQANLERDEVLLQIAEDQKDAGVATALDVTRAEVGLAGNELGRLQQETTVLQSALVLKQILNLPLENELLLKVEPVFAKAEEIPFADDTFTKLLRNRPDYLRLQTELERETLALGAAKREHLPTVELTGEWGYAAQSWSDPMAEQWAVQLGVSLPVFEGFRIDSEKRQAASALRRKGVELDDLETRIEAEYRLILQQLQSSARQVEVAKRARDLSEREFALERIRFEEGVADNSNVVIAQTNLADAEDTFVEAEFQYILARINLARAEGDVLQLVDGD